MADFFFNRTSQENGSNYSNITFFLVDYEKVSFAIDVITCIIICIGLPLTLVAIYAVYSLVRNDHVAPIYIINLLISDFIQLCCLIPWVTIPQKERVTQEDVRVFQAALFIYDFCLVTSILFMVTVALERFLVIACPLWYRFRRSIKTSVVVSVMVWVFPPAFILPVVFLVDFEVSDIIFGISLLLPLPLLIFFLSGTLKALSASHVPSDEKRRIVGLLVLVLLIYTLLNLPRIIWFLTDAAKFHFTFYILAFMLPRLSPLADLTLYVFMRKGIIDHLLASVCCCRKDSNETSSSVVPHE